MPIFSKPNAIVYVRRSGMVIAGKKLTPARMTFMPDHIENMEVLDQNSFVDSMKEFFAQNGLKGKYVLMVLDDSIVFSKSIAVDADTQRATVAEAFIDSIPLAQGQRACLRVGSDTELRLYATNGELYSAIADALDQTGVSKLLAVTPAAAYPSEAGKQQLAAAVQQYITDSKVRGNANFLHATLV